LSQKGLTAFVFAYQLILGGEAAENRGADFVKLLVLSEIANAPNQTTFACTAPGAGSAPRIAHRLNS